MKVLDPFFEAKISELQSLCKELDVQELYFFGSAINGKFIPGKSDLDVWVDTGKGKHKNIVRLQVGLAKLFSCDVDIFHVNWPLDEELVEYLKENKLLVYQAE